MKEKDPLLKFIQDLTGKEEAFAKIIILIISFFCIALLVYGFYMICELFKFIF